MLFKVDLTFQSVGKILKCDFSNESYWSLLLYCDAVYYDVQGNVTTQWKFSRLFFRFRISLSNLEKKIMLNVNLVVKMTMAMMCWSNDVVLILPLLTPVCLKVFCICWSPLKTKNVKWKKMKLQNEWSIISSATLKTSIPYTTLFTKKFSKYIYKTIFSVTSWNYSEDELY